MNRPEHVTIGILAFIVYSLPIYFIINTIPEGFLYGLFAVILGSIIPDIIEPASSYTHRGFFHSLSVLKYAVGIFFIIGFIGFLSAIIEVLTPIYILAGFCLGYSLHLLADSTTPMGLPR